MNAPAENKPTLRAWPDTLTRMPYWVYQDPEVLTEEQRRIFEGPVWNFLCLEVEIPHRGDWRATHMGAISGKVLRGFHCIYHAAAWYSARFALPHRRSRTTSARKSSGA